MNESIFKEWFDLIFFMKDHILGDDGKMIILSLINSLISMNLTMPHQIELSQYYVFPWDSKDYGSELVVRYISSLPISFKGKYQRGTFCVFMRKKNDYFRFKIIRLKKITDLHYGKYIDVDKLLHAHSYAQKSRSRAQTDALYAQMYGNKITFNNESKIQVDELFKKINDTVSQTILLHDITSNTPSVQLIGEAANIYHVLQENNLIGPSQNLIILPNDEPFIISDIFERSKIPLIPSLLIDIQFGIIKNVEEKFKKENIVYLHKPYPHIHNSHLLSLFPEFYLYCSSLDSSFLEEMKKIPVNNYCSISELSDQEPLLNGLNNILKN
jgi:hypothetical protein